MALELTLQKPQSQRIFVHLIIIIMIIIQAQVQVPWCITGARDAICWLSQDLFLNWRYPQCILASFFLKQFF